jgi:hypothetical protein
MFKLHFLEKIIKRNVLNHTIDFKSFVQQKHVPFCESTHSLGELDEKPNHTKISNSCILKERVAKQRTHFFNHLAKN